MKKFSILVFIFTTMLLMFGCGGSSNSDSESAEYDDSICEYGTYKCEGNVSYYCGYSGDDLLWKISEDCDTYAESFCDSSTGKCYHYYGDASSDNNSNSNSENDTDNNTAEGDTRTKACSGLPKNAEWNTVSKITQTYECYAGKCDWIPEAEGIYDTNSSTSQCHFKCIEDYLWNGSECILDPCKSEPCRIVENGTGVCVNLEAGKYECECAEGFLWSGEECLDPCSPNPCRNVEHSTKICTAVDAKTYKCACEDTYAWNGSECLNPCEPNPCVGVENSTETCIKEDDFTLYKCECNDTYAWNGIECLNPCEPNPCASVANSPEVCIKEDNFTKYSCKCNDTFAWNGSECLNPCEPNPCAGVVNSPGICVKEDDFTNYSCKCYKNFIWTGTQCACSIPECSPTSNTPCVDSKSGLMWSSISSYWMDWEGAVEYCNNLSEGDFTGWHLPTISELRTIIQNCPATEPGGACKVTDSCLASTCQSVDECNSCAGIYDNGGYYSKLGDEVTLWSSSTLSDYPDYAWYIGWGNGGIAPFAKVGSSDSFSPIRCVRKKSNSCF